MASETVTLTTICAGNNHLEFTLSGAKSGVVRMTLDELSEEISREDAEAFCRVITRLVKIGKTNAQARTVLQAGVTVVV